MTKPAWGRFAAEFRAVRTPSGRARYGQVALEGLRVCERALRAGARLRAALVAESFAQSTAESMDGPGARRARLLEDLVAAGVEPLRVADEVLEELCEGRDLGRIVALASLPSPADLSTWAVEPGLALVACDVEEPGNVGALGRTALASGAGLFATTGISDPFHPKAVRTSMGSLFRLGVLQRASTAELVRELAQRGVRSVAAVSQGGIPLDRAVAAGIAAGARPLAVLVGSEAFGLEPEVVEAVEERVTIPMANGVDSYSVNAAAAILCWTLGRAAGRGTGRETGRA